MKKYLLTTLLSLLACYTSFAQDGRIEYRPKCGLIGFPFDEVDEPAMYKGNINKYFSKQINWKKLVHIGGLILIDVAVDTLGNPCTIAFYNRTINSDHEVLYLFVDNIINKMPLWQPAIKNGHPINSTTRIALYSSVEGHGDFEADYYRTFAQQTEKIKVIPKQNTLMNMDYDEIGREPKGTKNNR